ncbi:hypothetical protein F8388_004841 [Cannabis sativa]|uniref:RNase H type-1 domain-containing protein n=1 Tax=Cannabis sativa TaxID=3483 RepID=A0A7J6HNQ8_CANSA|nr:hypothetical protein F8388_004841 [Cannabis sativa]
MPQKDYSTWIIGKNSEVKVWNFSWSCSDGRLIKPPDCNPWIEDNLDVVDSVLNDGTDWNKDLVKKLFIPEATQIILSTNRSLFLDDDKLLLWGSDLHGHLKLFLWKLLKDCLPFGSWLLSIFGNHIGDCSLCGMDESDSSIHFFSLCSVTKCSWFTSGWCIRIDEIPFHSGGEMSTVVSVKSILRGELEAVVHGLEVLRRMVIHDVNLLTDYQQLAQAILKQQSPHWNLAYSFKLMDLMTGSRVCVAWVPRSSNNSAHVRLALTTFTVF